MGSCRLRPIRTFVRAAVSLISPTTTAGSITAAAPSPLRAHHPGRVAHLGRELGADNHAVYCDWLGLDERELAALAADGVI